MGAWVGVCECASMRVCECASVRVCDCVRESQNKIFDAGACLYEYACMYTREGEQGRVVKMRVRV